MMHKSFSIKVKFFYQSFLYYFKILPYSTCGWFSGVRINNKSKYCIKMDNWSDYLHMCHSILAFTFFSLHFSFHTIVGFLICGFMFFSFFRLIEKICEVYCSLDV
ncbi:hypothetical protein EDEG_03444 [Edhazardia aedis USNM 41457]|uniref:Uncharacterized protein n=1 Tax=Edhazardia aedis (strain USNM 41457) TaxID=1003232 RepID=J9DHM5_EDHAE|nr:hypothetical protein EDEG_03444 [Edhazardia aedis USNM 41457]|eukprot:EJW02105.1 hypothetical protein EDEG_03444 [Edhazardia aedis USNM 41457]